MELTNDQITIIDNHIKIWSETLKDLPVDNSSTNDIAYFLFMQDVFEPEDFWELAYNKLIDQDELERILFSKWINAFTELNRIDVVLMLNNVQLNGL